MPTILFLWCIFYRCPFFCFVFVFVFVFLFFFFCLFCFLFYLFVFVQTGRSENSAHIDLLQLAVSGLAGSMELFILKYAAKCNVTYLRRQWSCYVMIFQAKCNARNTIGGPFWISCIEYCGSQMFRFSLQLEAIPGLSEWVTPHTSTQWLDLG